MVTSWYIISEKLSPINRLNRTTYFISITKLEGHLVYKVVSWVDENSWWVHVILVCVNGWSVKLLCGTVNDVAILLLWCIVAEVSMDLEVVFTLVECSVGCLFKCRYMDWPNILYLRKSSAHPFRGFLGPKNWVRIRIDGTLDAHAKSETMISLLVRSL